MEEKKYSELSRYFTLKEWNNMSEYDRIRFYNILENYKVLLSLGKSVKKSQILIQLIQSYSEIHIFNGLYFLTYH
jgi:hypothetical protein